MARNPLIRKKEKSYTTPMKNQSAGILDDFAVRKVVATKEGSITRTPTADIDIANKKYVDDEVAGVATTGATGSFTAGSGETITVTDGLITFITSLTFLILLETGDKILMENGDNIENG